MPRTFLAILSVGLALGVQPARAEQTTVEVAISPSPESTRVVLTHSRRVGYIIETSRSRIRIRYAEPVDVRPPSERVDDPILERYRIRDNRTLNLYTGREYDQYESFELLNPFRLVLDLKAAPKGVDHRSDRWSRPQPAKIIVIDPGHGGVEQGAVGPRGVTEKQITLELARGLKRELEQGRPPVSVVLTRDEDRLVGLDERTAIANHNQADLFLSIHVNASPRTSATGAETYYLSTEATDDEARILAALENESTGGAGGRRNKDALDLVLWDLAQNQYLAESSALAESIQRHMNRLTGTRDRGVRQAPFRVLMGAMMPAVLVEVGFISNADEAERLDSPSYRRRVVTAIAAATREFVLNLDQYSAPGSFGSQTGRP